MHGQKNIKLWTWSCSGILKLLVWWKITNFSEDRNAFIFWMQTWGTNCRPLVGMWNRNAPTVCLETHKGVTHNWTHRLRKNHQNSCIYGNLQHLCKSIGRWETLNWILPAGWSDIPHFTRQHGRNSVLFRRPRHFEGTLVTALARSDADWLFLMGISERESLPKQTTNILQGYAVAQLVQTLSCKPEGRHFDSQFFIELILPAFTVALRSTQLLTKMSTRYISWGYRRPERRADSLTTFMFQLYIKSGSLNFLKP